MGVNVDLLGLAMRVEDTRARAREALNRHQESIKQLQSEIETLKGVVESLKDDVRRLQFATAGNVSSERYSLPVDQASALRMLAHKSLGSSEVA